MSNNSFEGANAPISESSTATTEAVETVVEQGGTTTAQSVGEDVIELSNVKVTAVRSSVESGFFEGLKNYFKGLLNSFTAEALRIPLSSVVVAGYQYEVFMNVPKEMLRWQDRLRHDPYLYYTVQGLSIGSGAMGISKLALKAAKNGIKSGYQYAKGKVSQLFKKNVGNSLKYNERTFQHMFSRHAKDFGLTESWNKASAAKFDKIISGHVKKFKPIKGNYRGTQPALHHFDPKTGLNVMTDLQGNLIGGWKLSTDQIRYLLKNGGIK